MILFIFQIYGLVQLFSITYKNHIKPNIAIRNSCYYKNLFKTLTNIKVYNSVCIITIGDGVSIVVTLVVATPLVISSNIVIAGIGILEIFVGIVKTSVIVIASIYVIVLIEIVIACIVMISSMASFVVVEFSLWS